MELSIWFKAGFTFTWPEWIIEFPGLTQDKKKTEEEDEVGQGLHSLYEPGSGWWQCVPWLLVIISGLYL